MLIAENWSHLEYMFSTEVEEGTTLPLVATSILQINVFCAVQLATYFWHLFAFRWWFCCLSYCCFSVTKTCLTLCDPMNCSTPGLHVPHHPLEFAQIHVHWMCDVIQPSHPLSPSSLSVFNLPVSGVFPISQLFASGGQSIGASPSASVLPKSIQGWFPLRLTCLILFSKGLSQESSPAPYYKGINSSAFCLLYGSALTTIHDHWEDHSLDYMDLCWQRNISDFQHTV